MIGLVIYIASVAAALGAGALAAWSDFRTLKIPNRYHAVIAAAFGAGFLAAWLGGADIFESLPRHMAAAGIVFAVTFVLFSLNVIGGGDSKLLTVFALWGGLSGLATLVVYTVFAGGIAGIAALSLKGRRVFRNAPAESWIGRVQAGESRVAYSIPIAIGAAGAFIARDYVGTEVLARFVAGKGS